VLLTTHNAVATSASGAKKSVHYCLYAASTIGHYVIRQRGTIGGSLCHADPAAQMPLIALTLGANFHIKGLNSNRITSAENFYLGAMTSCLAEDELLTAISYPSISPNTLWAFELFNRRHGDYAIVSVALCVDYDSNHQVKNIRIGSEWYYRILQKTIQMNVFLI
jgi:carbon-monoxide dehydrogenase medium subunit